MRILIYFCKAQVSLASRFLYSVVNLERWHQGFKHDSVHSSTMFLVVETQEDYQGYRTKDLCLAIQFTIEQVMLFSLSVVHRDWQQRNNVFWTVRYAYHILISHLYMSDIWFCSGISRRNIYVFWKYCFLERRLVTWWISRWHRQNTLTIETEWLIIVHKF